MKIRTGFVSNSSSSSFCVIGVTDETVVKKLYEAEGLKQDEWGFPYGCDGGKVVSFYGRCVSECCAGIPAEKTLQDMSIKQARLHFCDLVKKKLKVDIRPDQVDLHYGEASSE